MQIEGERHSVFSSVDAWSTTSATWLVTRGRARDLCESKIKVRRKERQGEPRFALLSRVSFVVIQFTDVIVARACAEIFFVWINLVVIYVGIIYRDNSLRGFSLFFSRDVDVLRRADRLFDCCTISKIYFR